MQIHIYLHSVFYNTRTKIPFICQKSMHLQSDDRRHAVDFVQQVFQQSGGLIFLALYG